MPCPDARNFIATSPSQTRDIHADYTDENSIFLIGSILNYLEEANILGLDLYDADAIFTGSLIDGIFRVFAQLADAVGNDDAAKNLNRFLDGGSPMESYNVEKMIRELPRWVEEIVDWSGSSTKALLDPTNPDVHPLSGHPPHCRVVSNATWWRRVGQGSGDRNTVKNIYSTNGMDLAIGSRDFKNMYSNNLYGAYSREEFDWYVAMNAFEYYIQQGVVANENTRTLQVCYRIVIEDEYAWYINSGTGSVDRIMARLDQLGLAHNYPIRGRSEVRCELFDLDAFNDGHVIFQVPRDPSSD